MDRVGEIVRLRSIGYSVPEISSALGIPKTTVYYHAKKVILTKSALRRLKIRKNGSKILSERHRESAKEKSSNICAEITDNQFCIIASMIYWCEGARKDLSLMNSDPNMIRLFLFILRSFYGIKNQDVKISIRIYEDLDRQVCLDFWSEITNIKLDQATSVDILHGKKVGKLKYGMCRVRVIRGGVLLKQLEEIRNRVVEILPS